MILGIDLGFKGALSFLDVGLDIVDMPTVKRDGKTYYDLPTIIALIRYKNPSLACVEDVWSRPTDGHTGAFRFGEGKGIFEGILTTLQIEQLWISPQKWKKFYDLWGQDKDASRAKVIELFPQEAPTFARKKDHGRAESCLIARYGGLMTGLTIPLA
jgi:crossover junction endodeoxyribonuclease RuvC